jgi:CRP-like cAMP-binding protein
MMAGSRSEFLDSLPEQDLQALKSRLDLVTLSPGEVLEWAGTSPSHIVFPISGAVSLELRSGRHSMQVALVGNRGVVGAIPALWGGDSTHDAIVQFPGQAWRIEAENFAAGLAGRYGMHQRFFRFASDLTAEVSLNALASGRGTVTERLARWLLNVADTLESDSIKATHDLIAHSLGVRRSGVTNALHILEEMQAVRAQRGRLHILDGLKLRAAAGGF